MTHSTRRTSIVCLALIAALAVPGAARLFTTWGPVPDVQAAERSLREVVLRLIVPRPDGENTEVRRLKHQELAKLTAERIRSRLAHAGIKDYRVDLAQHGVLTIRAHTNLSRQALASIVIPRGQMELRPVVHSGGDWESIMEALPRGIELRQDIDTLDTARAYLWSASASALEAFVSGIALGASQVYVYPDTEGGWRTVTLGAPVATHLDLAGVERKRTPAGNEFIRLEFAEEAPVRMVRELDGIEVDELAVVLDGELVARVRYVSDRLTHHLELTSPAHLRTETARSQWVRQVSGRLATPIPITLAEWKE